MQSIETPFSQEQKRGAVPCSDVFAQRSDVEEKLLTLVERGVLALWRMGISTTGWGSAGEPMRKRGRYFVPTRYTHILMF